MFQPGLGKVFNFFGGNFPDVFLQLVDLCLQATEFIGMQDGILEGFGVLPAFTVLCE